MRATFAILFAYIVNLVSATISFGACKPLADQGLADVAVDTTKLGTEKWMNLYRTRTNFDSFLSQCPHSYFKFDTDKLQEYRIQNYWYLFFQYGTNIYRTKLTTSNGLGYQSLGLLDTDFSQTVNYKLYQISTNEMVSYRCVNNLFGLWKDEQVVYYVKQANLAKSMSDFAYHMVTNYAKIDWVNSFKSNLVNELEAPSFENCNYPPKPALA